MHLNTETGTDIDLFVNKETRFRFDGVDMVFALSHSLFSSFDIDQGTKLLLKSIAQQIRLTDIRSVLDLGSGVGVLGIALKKSNPNIILHSTDKDALALSFTRSNALRNGILDCRVFGSVGLMSIPEQTYDLVVSNIPAKAGNKAITGLITGVASYLTLNGIFAFVIVRTLEKLTEEAVSTVSGKILYRVSTKNHSVFHISFTSTLAADRSIEPNIRGSATFSHRHVSYTVKTVFGLPDFDTLNFSTKLLFDTINNIGLKGKILVYNPGQGHIPVYLNKIHNTGALSVTLASRDLLSLEISRLNCIHTGMEQRTITTLHIPSIFQIQAMYDHIIIDPDRDPGSTWMKYFFRDVFSHLKRDGLCITSSKSSLVFGILDNFSEYRMMRDKRGKGFRAVVVKKGQ